MSIRGLPMINHCIYPSALWSWHSCPHGHLLWHRSPLIYPVHHTPDPTGQLITLLQGGGDFLPHLGMAAWVLSDRQLIYTVPHSTHPFTSQVLFSFQFLLLLGCILSHQTHGPILPYNPIFSFLLCSSLSHRVL